MAEPSTVMAEVVNNTQFRNRVRFICISTANLILEDTTPDPGYLSWAKLVVERDYDSSTESALIVAEAAPATVEVAYNASDTVYTNVLNAVLPRVIKAKDLP